MMAIGGGAAGSASMAGTITILKVGEQAKAYIAPSAVVAAGGNVIILADSSQKILVINGSVSGAGAASLGVATNVLKIANKTQAYIGDGAQVTANANGSAEAGADGSISSSVKDGYSKNLNGSVSTADMDYVSSSAGSSGMTRYSGQCEIRTADPHLCHQRKRSRFCGSGRLRQCCDL